MVVSVHLADLDLGSHLGHGVEHLAKFDRHVFSRPVGHHLPKPLIKLHHDKSAVFFEKGFGFFVLLGEDFLVFGFKLKGNGA